MKYKIRHKLLKMYFTENIVNKIETYLLPAKNPLSLKDLLYKSNEYYTNYNGKKMYVCCYKLDWSGKYYDTISLHCNKCHHIMIFKYAAINDIDFGDCICD